MPAFTLCCVCTAEEACEREQTCLIKKAHLDRATIREQLDRASREVATWPEGMRNSININRVE